MALAAAGCSSSGSHRSAAPTPQGAAPAASPTTAATTTTAVPAGATTTTPPPTSGPRTVLAQLGLNVRASPSTSAKVLGTAARGAVLTVLGYNPGSGGWLEVKGATVTGWISADPALSAPGQFSSYSSSSGSFATLYPAGWSVAKSGPSGVVLRDPSGTETVTFRTAAAASQLPAGRSGYLAVSSRQILVCGVTSQLVTYRRAGTPASTATSGTSVPNTAAAEPYLAQVRLSLDKTHALGIYAELAEPNEVATVFSIASSVTFPFPSCGA